MIDAFKRDVLYKDDEVSAAVIDLIEAGRIIFVPAAASWRETGRLYNADPEATSESIRAMQFIAQAEKVRR
jgi:hypothetical protein